MKKIVLPAFAAVSMLGLAACGDSDAPAAGEAESATYDVAADPAADPAMSADMTADGADTVSISGDGVSADINDGDTSVSADIGEDPSVTVTSD